MSTRGQSQEPAEVNSFCPNRIESVRQDLPIFSQDWWLDVARGTSDYHELKVFSGKHVVGRLPFILSRRRFGVVRGHDPYWSHLGGPILDTELSPVEQAGVLRSLLNQLPRRMSFSFVCDPTSSYSHLLRAAFAKAGFTHSKQVTYIRFPNEQEVLASRKSKHRGHFKRAAKNLECVDISPAEFVRFFEGNLKARGKKSYAPLATLCALLEEAIARGRARVIAARPRPSNTSQDGCYVLSRLYDAAIAYVWDTSRCYYWLSTNRVASEESSLAKPHPDAIKLLAFRAMEHAQAANLVFDADGVATPGADHLYRNIFGLTDERYRDVFERVEIVDRLYEKCRSRFHAIVSQVGAQSRSLATNPRRVVSKTD